MDLENRENSPFAAFFSQPENEMTPETPVQDGRLTNERCSFNSRDERYSCFRIFRGARSLASSIASSRSTILYTLSKIVIKNFGQRKFRVG